MDTRIKDFSGSLMAGSMNKLREAKASKAEAAFYSLFDSAVKNNAGKDNTADLGQLSANAAKSDGADVSAQQNTKAAADTVRPETTQQGDASENVKNDVKVDDSKQTAVEKAEAVIKKICDELGIDEEQLIQQMDGLMESIMALLMQEFDVTKEQLNQVLDSMGLTVADLLDKTDLMSVLVELSGAEDISAVLTNEELYVQTQDIVQQIATLQEDFAEVSQLSPEELQKLSQSIETVRQPEKVQENPEPVAEQPQDVADMPDTEQPVLEITAEKVQPEKDSSQPEHSMTGQEGFQQFTGRVAQFVQETVRADGSMFAQNVDMEEIIRQIVDHVKLEVQPDTTSLEMQLHPESYGKLNLHVSVREGVVTAQMAVENEMVRSALEAQVVMLKDEMAARGLKVDAVEVTIASHEFERNLDEGQQEQEHAQETDSHTHRRINLQSEPLTLEELMEMSESEALTRKIMLENGNSIDYSA